MSICFNGADMMIKLCNYNNKFSTPWLTNISVAKEIKPTLAILTATGFGVVRMIGYRLKKLNKQYHPYIHIGKILSVKHLEIRSAGKEKRF